MMFLLVASAILIVSQKGISAITNGKKLDLERVYCFKNIHFFLVCGLIHTNCGVLVKR